VLRICTGADCPRKNTASGKSLAWMSDDFSTVSLSGFGSADCAKALAGIIRKQIEHNKTAGIERA